MKVNVTGLKLTFSDLSNGDAFEALTNRGGFGIKTTRYGNNPGANAFRFWSDGSRCIEFCEPDLPVRRLKDLTIEVKS